MVRVSSLLLLALLAQGSSAFQPVSVGGVKPLRSLSSSLSAATVEAPVRKPESADRVQQVRARFRKASEDAAKAKGCSMTDSGDEWWRQPVEARTVSQDDPLRVLVAGGGVAGLVTAAACHAKGMKVAIFEQASQYAPYGGPIQIQSNALAAIRQINPQCYEELVQAGTVTADRISGLKIGYQKGVFLGLGEQYEKGDWLVRFDTLQPALEAGLPATVVVDRPVIQQILLEHGIPEGTVRIKSRIANYQELGPGKGIQVTLEDGTVAYADVLVGADGIWSSVRRIMHDLDQGADGFAASGAAGGALNEAEARRMAKDSVLMANNANRRYSGFTCYAALTEHKASNIEDVSYQILLGKDKYFVSTDGGGERQQWFALIREEPGGVDAEATANNPSPKLDRLLYEFTNQEPGDQNGDVWDGFAHELLQATPEADIKRRDLYDGSPLIFGKGWTRGQVAICGDAAHPMMPNLGQGGCQATEDGYRLAEELATVQQTTQIEQALQTYYWKRIPRTTIIQILAQLGSDLLVDFDKMMTIPLVGPFFLYMTQFSMPFILRFLYTAKF